MTENHEETVVDRKFIYVKPYVQEKVFTKDANGKISESTPKLNQPMFRDSYTGSEVTFNKNKINGYIASVDFRDNYNKDGYDLNVLMVTEEHYCIVQVSMKSVMGQQLAKRLMNVDYSRKAVLEVWKNNKGYANLSVYQRDTTVVNEKGIHPKQFVADAFKDEDVPDVVEVKIGKKVERDSSERIDFIKGRIEVWKDSNEEAAVKLKENAGLVTMSGAGVDDGIDDV